MDAILFMPVYFDRQYTLKMKFIATSRVVLRLGKSDLTITLCLMSPENCHSTRSSNNLFVGI